MVTLADEAAELLRMPKSNDPHAHWKWAYLWPLIAVRLDEGKIAEAVEAGLQMLDPSQQQLPDELESLLESAAQRGQVSSLRWPLPSWLGRSSWPTTSISSDP